MMLNPKQEHVTSKLATTGTRIAPPLRQWMTLANFSTQLRHTPCRWGGMTTVLIWTYWVLFVGVAMAIERNLRIEEDFAPNAKGFFVLAAISPFLVLPVYLYSAYRSSTTGHRALAALAGLPLTYVCFNLAMFHAGLTSIVLHHLVA